MGRTETENKKRKKNEPMSEKCNKCGRDKYISLVDKNAVNK